MLVRYGLFRTAIAAERVEISKIEDVSKAIKMPWEETKEYIRSGHENADKYDKDSIRTITISEDKGIKAIVGCPKGRYDAKKCDVGTHLMSYLFAKDKGWTIEKSQAWFEKNKK